LILAREMWVDVEIASWAGYWAWRRVWRAGWGLGVRVAAKVKKCCN